MIEFEPKYITFDCYGTLTAFGMSAVTRELVADRVAAEQMEDFLDDFEAFRGDEVLGAYKPYHQVINDALARTAKLWGIEHRDSDGQAIYESVPSWGPHPDVPEPLAALARALPAGDPLQRRRRADPEQRRQARRAVPRRVHRRAGPGLQAPAPGVRVHARPARLRTAGHPARLLQPALRPDARARPAGDQQGLRQPRLRAQHAVLRLPRGPRPRRPAASSWASEQARSPCGPASPNRKRST